jgi:hypothetical protein
MNLDIKAERPYGARKPLPKYPTYLNIIPYVVKCKNLTHLP